MSGSYTTPLAIVVAGGLIGLGLYTGLRERGPVSPAAPPPDSRPVPSTSGSSTSGEPAPSATTAPRARADRAEVPVVASRDAVTRAAVAAVGQHRAALVEKCWKPNATKTPPPTPAKLTFNFSFDASGKQIVRGVQVARGAGSAEITSCVLQSLPPISVPPPGAPATVDVELTLP